MSPRATQQAVTSVCSWRCDRPTRDGALVCEACLDELAAGLRELQPSTGDRPLAVALIRVVGPGWEACPFPRPMETVPGLWDELRATLVGERAISYDAVGGTSGGTSDDTGAVVVGIQLHDNASWASSELERALRGLVRLCQEFRLDHNAEPGWKPRAGVLVPDMAAWLGWRVDAMAWQPEVADNAAYVAQLIDYARWVVDRPATRQQLGECPVQDCDGRLSAVQGATFASCFRCRVTVEAQPLRDGKLTELGDRLCSAAEIAGLSTYLGFRANRDRVADRIRQWAHRDRLTEHGRSSDGHPLYRFGEAYALLLEAEQRAEDRTSKPLPHTNTSTSKGA